MIKNAFLRTFQLGVKSLMLHKLRSGLTTLGMLFGVASVVAMLAIGEGASKEAQEQIKQLGSNNIILRSIKPSEEAVSNQSTRVSVYGLTDDDFDRIQDTFPWIDDVVPVRVLQQEVRYGDTALNPRVLATTAKYQEVTGRPVLEGRFISTLDEESVSNVVVLGYEVSRALFPFRTPIGERIKIGPDYFHVIGVLLPRVPIGEANQGAPGAEVTGEVIVPMSTGRKWFGDMQVKIRAGSRDMEQVDLHEIIVGVDRSENVPAAAAAAREMLSRNHRENDYEIVVPLELLLREQETKRIFKIVLASIAGISLLVGGIGIMNVMLATVTERTREIGVRRALGAKKKHIVMQFLVETVVLSVGGGVLGIALGLAIPEVVAYYTDMAPVVTPAAPLLAFAISVGTGLLFGMYPAWRAANMDPVEALRHE
jgi:putative ABC transport system permease protein